MRLDHIALWTHRLEAMRDFYVRWFGGSTGQRFEDPRYGFASYFVSFPEGARLELMQMPSIPHSRNDVHAQFTGYIHIAFALPDRERLHTTLEALRAGGTLVLEDPHLTADGYFEATILDPDGNRVELAVGP